MSRALSLGYWRWTKHCWTEPLFWVVFFIFPLIKMSENTTDPWIVLMWLGFLLAVPGLVMWEAYFHELDRKGQLSHVNHTPCEKP